MFLGNWHLHCHISYISWSFIGSCRVSCLTMTIIWLGFGQKERNFYGKLLICDYLFCQSCTICCFFPATYWTSWTYRGTGKLNCLLSLKMLVSSSYYFLNYLQAIQQYGDVDVFTSNFRPLKATVSGLPDRTFMKLVVCAKTNKVLGLHMCGEDAPEIVQVSSFLFSQFGALLRARLARLFGKIFW
uniref:Pyridine nucleotide-disulphide oxidoreductase dimerisation domain-containing protein n=1 Tax=Nelumbo nucifera TaxID=4432 RepID=A0A822YSC3_NELNU|nr:TPA_asm: hypothetical protein HUJ06_006030 [Nelumbo nucifera]